MRRWAVLAVLAVLPAGACTSSIRSNTTATQRRHNPTGLGAGWGVITATLGTPTAPPVVTPDGVTEQFGRCDGGRGAEFSVTSAPLRPGQVVDEQPVVEVDQRACAAAPALGEAQSQALRFFPDLSGVVNRRSTSIVYQSQPLVRLVPSAQFFRCQWLASSAERLGRFSLRLDATGWTLAVGDCVNDRPPATPSATEAVVH